MALNIVLGCNSPVETMMVISATQKSYIPLDEVAKVIKEKFQTTVSADLPTLAQLSTMSKEQAVALAGKRRRVPFIFIVVSATCSYPHRLPDAPHH